MRVAVVTPPEPVVSWADAQAHLRLDTEDDKAMVEGMVAAATAHIDGPEGWLGRALGPQTLEARRDVFRDAMSLRYGPVIEIVSVGYLTADGTGAEVPASDYELRGWVIGSAFGRRWPAALAHPESVCIRYRAGYETLPAPIRAAILLMTGDLYRNRETVAAGAAVRVPMSTTVENLLAPFRVFG